MGRRSVGGLERFGFWSFLLPVNISNGGLDGCVEMLVFVPCPLLGRQRGQYRWNSGADDLELLASEVVPPTPLLPSPRSVPINSPLNGHQTLVRWRRNHMLVVSKRACRRQLEVVHVPRHRERKPTVKHLMDENTSVS